MEAEINPIPGPEESGFRARICEVRFDCVVKMADYGVGKKSKKPQWFSLILNITLEEIEHGDDMTTSRLIRGAYHKLKQEILKYEETF